MKVILAQPRGFCAGVVRAIEIVERALQLYGPPVYVRHEIVHNKHVVESLKAKGARFVEDLSEVPALPSPFSAPTASPRAWKKRRPSANSPYQCHLPAGHQGAQSGQRYWRRAAAHADRPRRPPGGGRHDGANPEPVTLVQNESDVALDIPHDTPIAYVTQTTLSVDDTKESSPHSGNFPAIAGPELRDICYATQNRQNAVRELSTLVDLMLVIGAKNVLIPIGCAKSATRPVFPAISSPTAARCSRNGLTARRRSASPPGHRRRKCWSKMSSTHCGGWDPSTFPN